MLASMAKWFNPISSKSKNSFILIHNDETNSGAKGKFNLKDTSTTHPFFNIVENSLVLEYLVIENMNCQLRLKTLVSCLFLAIM